MTLGDLLRSEKYKTATLEEQERMYYELFPEEKPMVMVSGVGFTEKYSKYDKPGKLEIKGVDLGTPLKEKILEPAFESTRFSGNTQKYDKPERLPIQGIDLGTPFQENEEQRVIEGFLPVPEGYEIKDMSDQQINELSPTVKGMSNSIAARLSGRRPWQLSEDAPLKDKIQFALGKGIMDLPVFAAIGAASAGMGVGPMIGMGIAGGVYEGLDRGTDLYARGQHGTLGPEEQYLDPVEEGLSAVLPGAGKWMAGHALGKVAMGGVGIAQNIAGRAGANQVTAKMIANISKPVAYELAQNVTVGELSAVQHGYEYTGEDFLVDMATTGALGAGNLAGRKGIAIYKKGKGKPEAVIESGSDLHDYAEAKAAKIIDDTATTAAQRYFKRGGNPEETANLTLKAIDEHIGGFGHPFKSPEDMARFRNQVYEQAKRIDADNNDILSLNQKDAVLEDGIKLSDLGANTKASRDNLTKLEKLRGEERDLIQEYDQKVGKVSPDEIDAIKFKLEGVRNRQKELFTTEYRGRQTLYGIMKKHAKNQDKMTNLLEKKRAADDIYYSEQFGYATNGTKHLLAMGKEAELDMALSINKKASGAIYDLFAKTIKFANRNLETVLGKRNADVFLSALRGADAVRTETINRYYKILEEYSKSMTAAEIRVATISMIMKQQAWGKRKGADGKTVKGEDGKAIKELVNVGMKKLAAMKEYGYVTEAELNAANNLNQKQLEFVDASRTMLDEIWVTTNKARKIMGKNEIEPLPDYFPLANDIDNMEIFGASKVRGSNIGWLDDMPFRNKQTPNDPKNLKHRLDSDSIVNLDGIKVLEAYSRYMVNKAYMNPVAEKLARVGMKINQLHGNKMGDSFIKHAKYISGDIDPIPGQHFLTKTARNVAQAMLVGNYSTYITQLSALDGIIAEAGFVRVHKTIKELMDNPAMWEEVVDGSAVLTARRGAGDISIVDLQNSLQQGLRRKIIEKGMYPIQALDMIAATIGWKSFYDQAVSRGMRDGDARIYADDMVVKTQASASRVDSPPVMRNALGKNVFTLQTFALNRFDYLVSDVFGVQPVYQFMQRVDDLDYAQELADRNGWIVEKLKDGKHGYAVYDQRKAIDYMEATKKMAKLLIVQTMFNAMYDSLEEVQPLPLAKPNPDMLGAYNERRYGQSTVGLAAGGAKKVSRLSDSEQHRRALWAAAQEGFEHVPVASSFFKYNDSMVGAPVSKVISGGRRLGYFAETGNPITGLQAANDLTTLLGNPLYAPLSKILTAFKRHEQMEDQINSRRKEDERIFKKRYNSVRDSRGSSRGSLRIER